MKSPFTINVVLFMLSILFAVNANAGTYWVHPSGSAAWNNCLSETDPGAGNYCSLGSANSNATAGDTIILKSGEYSTTIAPGGSGSNINQRIIYQKAPGEEEPLFNNLNTPIDLGNRSWIKVDGVNIQNAQGYSASLQNYSSYNEITNCKFSDSANFMIRGMCSGGGFTCNAKHNWVHNNLFENMAGSSSACGEGGDALRLGGPWVDNGEDDYNTIEDNTFIGGGHGLIDSYGFHYAVIRNNVGRNNPWNPDPGSGPCGGRTPVYTNTDWNNKWGHRGFQIGFTYAGDRSYSLVEGNRLGYQSTNAGNMGDSNLSIAGRGMLVRYNSSFGAMRMGMYFKYVNYANNSLGGSDSRVYNNTVWNSGYGYEGSGIAPTRRVAVTYDEYADAHTENHVRNNIFYLGQDGTFDKSMTSLFYFDNNWCTSSGDGCTKYGNPLFNDAVQTDIYISAYAEAMATRPDLRLQATSPAIDGGIHLTTTTNAGNNVTNLSVSDALFFQDGSWGSDLARGDTLFPDWIAIGTVSNVVQISSINYSTNTITLASPMNWGSGDRVWLYKKSDGKRVLYGSAPDYGAYPYVSISPPGRLKIIRP